MEPSESATGQKSTKEPRERNQLHRKWGSEPTAGTRRSTFADPEGKRHSHCDAVQSSSSGSAQKYGSGKLQISTAVGQQPQEKQYPQHFPSTYSYPLPHSFSQQSIPQTFLQNAKSQPSLEAHAWQFANQLQSVASEDLFSMQAHTHGGVFPRRKSPSLPAAYSQYSQSGMEQPEEIHKKEQKSKKPGKYICHYCGRACAKPSVLKKHIRSHTGERPYPCVPCGFSFKTKSNLYKHRKSHAHAIKAGLVPFSDLVSARSDMEQASSFGEAEVHSDGEQSTDTEEETALSAESSPIPQISFKVDKSTVEKSGELTYVDTTEELAVAAMKVPILIVPKSGIQPSSECSQLSEIEASQNPALVCRDESHTIKQRLAMRLSEKKGQDSEQSLNLLSPHSKGSTDSGYFSRSESAEQQISPPNTNAKSYEEIMFGKYYRLNPRTAMTVEMAVEGQDTNVMDIKEKSGDATSKFGISKIIEDHISQLITDNETVVDPSKHSNIKLNPFSRGESSESQMLTGLDAKQYPAGSFQSKLLEPLSDTGPLVRSNSMPTTPASNLNIPQGVRGSHSFDERITSDDVFYPGTAGLPHRSMLRRQAAFELSSAHEGHSESENYGNISKNIVPPSVRVKQGEINPVVLDNKVQIGERSLFECELCGASYRRWEELETHKLLPCPEMHGKYRAFGLNLGAESCSEIFTQTQIMQHKQATETATRKRRKEKSVGDDEDLPGQYSSDHGTSVEMLVSTGDYDSKLVNLEATRAKPCVKAHHFSVHSQSDSFETGGTLLTSGIMTPEDVVLVPVSEKEASNRKTVGNVISVIQHTNSLSRPSSFEKSESIEHVSYQQDKPLTQHPNLSRDQSDSENIEEVHSPETAQQESMEQQQSDGRSSTQPQSHQQYHMPPRLVRQPNIQVPEIRVTEEPDKPEKEPVIQIKEPEKPVEEFQWPQRSETLSQLPAEKLPPKKKRLRLADMDHSSGESSFESTCTSLSRSPSQESNLSHSSSFSMSFDREENIKSVSPTKQDEFGKQSEFLTVPGSAHSLAIPSQHQQREMRRSSSEQAPCPLPTEVPEVRSKSFDYGYLSAASTPATSQNTPEMLGSTSNPSLISYLVTLPSIQVTQLMAPSEKSGDAQVTEYQRRFQSAFSEPYKHRLDVPSSMDEDYMLSPEHSSSSRDLSPSRLSSPGCDSSPHRETSPTSRRYLSPRRTASPRGHLSPRRDASPLRHLSPKREVSFRRELSPRRDLSPRRHLSPVSLGRPMSPGKDVSSRRELSPRSRHRAMIRAASPRRGSHHHNISWSPGQYLQSELAPLGQRNRTQSEMDTTAGKGMYEAQPGSHEPLNSPLFPGVHQGYLFSHLPLHSQQQIRVPFPMIPIGGIQMVHSVPSSVTGLVNSSRLPLQKSASEDSSTSEVSYPISESNKGSGGFTKQDKPVSLQLATSMISAGPLIPSLKETSWKTNEKIAEIIEKEKQQEESIQTCTKAIASLRIASEDIAPSETVMPLKVFDHHQKTLESAQLGIQHFSGSEDSHELACASATKPDSHTEKDNVSTSKTALAHSAFYNKSADERQLGQQGPTKLPTSTKIGKDSERAVLEKGKYN
ncbi:UNVERIFIED_CONTAM: hypothetical protein FKN15_010426 [Acipenser sinensis]